MTSWNAGAERIKGYTAEEIIGQHFSRFYTPSANERQGAAAGALHAPSRKADLRRKAGASARTARCSGPTSSSTPIRDEDGELIGFAKITRDITERREAQNGAQEAREATRPIPEDGCARPAHRRRRPRLQQSADGRRRHAPIPEERITADDRKISARRRSDRSGCAARRRADPAALDVLPATERQSADASVLGERIDAVRRWWQASSASAVSLV